MSGFTKPPLADICWRGARRLINSAFPTIDLFDDIADPADWPLLISAEQKTNPRLMETIGNLDLVPPARRVGGDGASFLMAPFVHASPDRPSRFSSGHYGVLYAGDSFDVALFETVHHYGVFMSRTKEAPGWTAQFRELVLDVEASLHDLRGGNPKFTKILSAEDYAISQDFGSHMRDDGSDGLVYPSVRLPGGQCAALFYPDLLATPPIQGRHLDYHWDGKRVDLFRDAATGQVNRIL